jgi:hypothetical protein
MRLLMRAKACRLTWSGCATRRLEAPRDPGPSARASARDLRATATREKPSAGGKEFAERYVHISCVTTVRTRASATARRSSLDA